MEITSKIFVSILLVSVCTFLLFVTNLNKNKRSNQKWMPLVSFIYSIVAVVFIWWLMETKLKEQMVEYKDAEVIISNLFLFLGFLLVKIIIKLFLKKKDIESNSNKYYEFDSVYHEWFLKDKYIELRKIFCLLSYGYTIVVGAILGAIWAVTTTSTWWTYIYPIIILIVIVEFYNYLNGYTKKEYSNLIFGTDSMSQNVSNYHLIKDIYEKMFGPQLLSSNLGCEFGEQKGISDLLVELADSEDDVEYITSKFFQLNENREKYDVDYIAATVKLMKKENVIFFNPFYRDLSKYIVLPIINSLICNNKCLVVVGRNSVKEDVRNWLNEIISDYCKFDSLWKVGDLNDKYNSYDVGLIGFHELYDLNLIERNKDFFNQTGFVIILEPSLVINTGQIGFSIVSEQMRLHGLSPVYCIVDRNVDGLVDTMSHLLHEKITNVIAPPAPKYINTSMSWDVDGDYMREALFDKQTRYLGNGMELAAVAIKNQIPKVTWISETKAPIKDIKWIVGQSYHTLCKFMNIPSHQQSIYEKIDFVANLWETEKKENQFLIVEDEFYNIFNMMKMFLSRGRNQIFVNVMSENYLLRDYMRYNNQMFKTNSNAIPSMVADYAKTERNTLLKLLFIMSYRPMSEAEIRKEFEMMNQKIDDVHFALTQLLKKYTFADENIFQIKSIDKTEDIANIESEFVYSVLPGVFTKELSKSLKSAYYIVENENKENDYIDAKLFSHVTQTILPGQFVVYDGKYYKVNHISVDNGVILRRASDLYSGRKYYRQMRTYVIENFEDNSITSKKNIMDVETVILRANFHVLTSGYLEMNNNNDLRQAKEIKITQESTLEEIRRDYRNKNILRIHIPDTTEEMRFTISLLLSEMFRTIFPSTWQYLAVLTNKTSDTKGMLNYMNYILEGDVDNDYIYIIEDSDVDLGLLETIDKNFTRFMEILADFIDWHFEKIRSFDYEDSEIESIVMPKDKEMEKRSKFAIANFLKRITKIYGKKNTDEELTIEDESVVKEPLSMDKEEPKEEDLSAEKNEIIKSKNNDTLKEDKEDVEDNNTSEIENSNYEDIFDEEGSDIDTDDFFEDIFDKLGLLNNDSKYFKECYLKFGFDEIDDRLKLLELLKYLNTRGWCDNSLTKARHRKIFDSMKANIKSKNHCDFCERPISGVSYDVLDDGRVRCNECSRTSIDNVDQFRDIFYQVLPTMESYFAISYNKPISIQTTDANTIAKGIGQVFNPSLEYTARVLGYAQFYKGTYRILIENGSPRLATILTMVHELTHIWQYMNWDDKEIRKRYGENKNYLMVYEGMAVWASVQYLYSIGEYAKAFEQEMVYANKDDVYGEGFRLYRQKYPFTKEPTVVKNSPFNVFPPL